MSARATCGLPGHVERVEVGPLPTNCYLVDDGTGSCVVVDPGADAAAIERALGGRGVSAVLVTHAHFDHVGALDAVSASARLGWVVGKGDAPRVDDPVALGARAFGVSVRVGGTPARTVAQGDVVEVGELRFRVISCPGHTPGGVCYVEDTLGAAFTGDTLFAGAAGRVDLPGGDEGELLRSLRRLAELPPAYCVLPGHGPASTIGSELAGNPFVRYAFGPAGA